MEYFDKGKGLIGNLFVSEEKLYLAIDRFNELITLHPDSDKIDDAAFQVGEIYRRYLKDYPTALLYYQRTAQWAPQTSLPARYTMALIYDEYYHDRVKAIQFYQQAIDVESAYPDNALHAQQRIEALSAELGPEEPE